MLNLFQYLTSSVTRICEPPVCGVPKQVRDDGLDY